MIPLELEGIKTNLYSIEPDGRIYSQAKKDYLIPHKDKDGYLYVFLQKTDGGRKNRICKKIAPLVAKIFIGEPPITMKDPTVNHIDGNKENNLFTNLEWMERGENSSIRKNKGQGESNHEAFLTETEVKEICELLIKTDLSLKEIGDKFSVDASTINNIYKKKNWKFLTTNYDFSCRQTIRDPITGRFKVINTNILRDDT